MLLINEASAYYTEAILGGKVTVDMLLGKNGSSKAPTPTAKKILDFFTDAARAYSKDAKLSREARRHYKRFKAMFDAFAEWNKGRNSATAVASEERRVNSEEVGESARYSKEIESKISNAVDVALQQKGKFETPYNQIRISEFPRYVSDMVDKASGGKILLANKKIAINGDDLWHEYIRHSVEEVETGRRQLPLTADTIKEAILAVYDPDLVESIFTTTDNPKQRKSFAYAKRSSEGYYIVVEVVGGKSNPNVTPTMILRFSEEKWNDMVSSGLTLGEILYDNDETFKSYLDVESNKSNRVTEAQFASI